MNLSWEKLSGMKKAYVFLLNSFILSQMVLVDLHNLAKRSFSCLLGTLVALESARSMGDSSHLLTINYTKANDNFLYTFGIAYFSIHNCNGNFVWTIATDDYCMLQISIIHQFH